MITIEIAWAAANLLGGEPALSVMSRIEQGGQLVDKTQHVIPLADLQSFNPPLSIWQLIEVACAPAAEAQERRDRATRWAIAKRARKQVRNRSIAASIFPLSRYDQDELLATMAGVLH